MKNARIPFVLMLLVALPILLLTGCTSMTQIQTIPPGAKVYINDEFAGETPFTMFDSKIIGSNSYIRLEKSGYKPFFTVISKTEEFDPGPVVCGFFCWPAWLWAMRYKPVHVYELVPLVN